MSRVEIADGHGAADFVRDVEAAAQVDQRRDPVRMRDTAHLADEDRMRPGLELLRQHAVECGHRIAQHRRAGYPARPLPERKAVIAIDALLAAEGESKDGMILVQ